MKRKSLLSLLLVFALLFTTAVPAFAASAVQAQETASADENRSVFAYIFDRLGALWNRLKTWIEVKKERVRNTMGQNVIHQLKCVTATIGDSYIITTADGKVLVIDGGHKTETDYFIEYLKAVTGQSRPHIDAWFLSHPHDDHCEVFLEIVEHRANAVTFDKVCLNFPPTDFYNGLDEWADTILHEYARLRERFADKETILREGDVLHFGAAKITVLYTYDPAFTNCNDASVIFRMDLAGTSVLFTGDAGVSAGRKTLANWQDTGLLDCDYCKMAHHGQNGVDQDFYAAVSPEVCLWPTPSWVWDNRGGNLQTLEVRAWIDALGVRKNYVAMDGSQTIRMKPRIVTTTDVFEPGYPGDRAVERLAQLGYDGLDMGLDYWADCENSPFLGDDYLTWAADLKARADRAGIAFTHAHAPGEADAGDLIGRSIETAAALGAGYCVVHPIWREANGRTIRSRARFLAVNAEAIRQWLPKAQACGVVLLSENLLSGASADPRVIAALVQMIDSPWFGWCFDVGHAHCSGYRPSILRQCAAVPLSLHIQDNDGSGDGHLIPGDGTVDWTAFSRVLQEIGYTGDCVLEAHHQSLEAPDTQRDAILARLLEAAKPLRDAME